MTTHSGLGYKPSDPKMADNNNPASGEETREQSGGASQIAMMQSLLQQQQTFLILRASGSSMENNGEFHGETERRRQPTSVQLMHVTSEMFSLVSELILEVLEYAVLSSWNSYEISIEVLSR